MRSFLLLARRPPLLRCPQARVFGPGSPHLPTFRVQVTLVIPMVLIEYPAKTYRQRSWRVETTIEFGRSRMANGWLWQTSRIPFLKIKRTENHLRSQATCEGGLAPLR